MIKLCSIPQCKYSNQIILKSCITKDEFPYELGKANKVPDHKKYNKQSLNNYSPISLLAIFG